MNLKSKNVFIDTQVYVRLGLDFNNFQLLSFQRLCAKEKLIHLTTTTLIEEVRSKIEERVSDYISKIRGVEKYIAYLARITGKHGSESAYRQDETEIISKAKKQFDKFLKKSKAQIIQADHVDAKDVLSLYFRKEPPFGEKKKKCEFPDAFTLLALMKQLDGEEAYIISGDNDLEVFCKHKSNLFHFKELSGFLDHYNKQANLSNQIKDYFPTVIGELKGMIGEKLDSDAFYNDAVWEGSEIWGVYPLKVHDFVPNIVQISRTHCKVAIDFTVEYDLIVSGYLYDSDPSWGMAERAIEVQDQVKLAAEVSITYQSLDDHEPSIDTDSLKISDFSILGIEGGIPVQADPTKCDAGYLSEYEDL